jgi:cyanophycin synthetase
VFSLDPDHPAIRWAMAEKGRALAPLDGWLGLIRPRRPFHPLVPLEEIPVTLAGVSSQHTQNAMAAAAAALGVGLSPEEVVEGLRGFVLDPETNPGRANLFEVDDRILVVD